MGKIKSGSTLALNKSEQKNVKNQVKKITKRVKATLTNKKEQKEKAEEKLGLVYIGHIPHGFYEDEMKEYFKQFGKVTNIKLCRSRKTGNSKGFGYVEFALPEVAKIAAESMNNYIMFKKRIVAEYVPYEKRPKHLFHGKSSTATSCSVVNRRKRQIAAKNKAATAKNIVQKSKSTLKNLQKKLSRLERAGIRCDVKPVRIPDAMNENLSEHSHIFVPDEVDSDIEFKVPRESKSKKMSVSSKKSLSEACSSKAMLTKSLDSVKTMLTRNGSREIKDEAVQTKLIRVKREKGISKKYKEKKKPPMNAKTVKKIAQELIRKKGNSLLNVISKPIQGKKSKK